MRHKILVFLPAFIFSASLFSQTMPADSLMIRRIFDQALTRGNAYQNLEKLCLEAPARLSASPNSLKAVDITLQMLQETGADSVYLQKVMVPNWVRGDHESGYIYTGEKVIPVKVLALGGSVGTGKKGIRAQVIEVRSIDELSKLPIEKTRGKIIFFNRALDKTIINTFQSYGGCADQRLYGANEAAKKEAIGVLVRSLTTLTDDHPHTGVMIYKEQQKLPAAAISTRDADLLSASLKEDPSLQLHLTLSCQTLGEALSYNVIGEIKGSVHPDSVIVIGGHLDSWDNSQGAHDDGAGCMHSIEVLYLLKALDYRPRYTIRCVLFMNEENGAKGADEYARVAEKSGQKHLAAIESDRGGFAPRGFTVENSGLGVRCYQKMQQWQPLFTPYMVHVFDYGGSGVDVSRLKSQGCALLGFIPDPQRYFDYHHADTDNFENVNQRELELGCATIAALVYLIDRHGL